MTAWRDMLTEKGLVPTRTAYVGDDILDVPLMRAAGFAAAVGDAEPCVAEAADYVAGRPGGNGAVREVAEFILRARGAWETVTAELLIPREDA